MNYYPFHIGDYMAHTAHLEPMEDLAYRRMIDLYYTREGELPSSTAEVAKLIRMRSNLETVEAVLDEFFEQTATGWFHKRCDFEVCEAQSKRMKAQDSAAQRWEKERKANAMRTHAEGNAPNPNPNPNPNPTPKGEPKPFGYPDSFEAAWNSYPSRPGASKKDAFRAWSARVKNGVDPEFILAGVMRYAGFCIACGTEPQYVKQPTTFFGPGEHFASDWTIPQQSRASPIRTRADERAKVGDVLTGRTSDERTNGRATERDITGEAYRVA